MMEVFYHAEPGTSNGRSRASILGDKVVAKPAGLCH